MVRLKVRAPAAWTPKFTTGVKCRQGGIQDDRRVLDTLPEQAADDAGVATELYGSVFSAF